MSTEASARRLFAYLSGEEWEHYRSILAVFADTFFAEFTPEDVADRLGNDGLNLAVDMVSARLESLVGWGNLTVSSSVGNPASLADYYRRRNRYLITRAGQEVHEVVEQVLARVDEVRDVATGRLGAVRDALVALAEMDVSATDTARLAETVRQVYDPHIVFTTEITQFFAAINQWQSRYDLEPDELTFFAEVLVGYVGDRIHEIERMARPIGRLLADLDDRTELIASRVRGELADRVERAGLGSSVAVSERAGSQTSDWDHLAAWFVSTPMRPSRIDRLAQQAVAAVRTLTLNLSRLSRVGIGASSRRADFLRLATFFESATEPDLPRLAGAAFGLYPPIHVSVAGEDVHDPVPAGTSWWDGPRAIVPISIRERGDTTNRGRVTPLRDRSMEQELVRVRRQQMVEDRHRVDQELIDAGRIHGAELSMQALARLQQLLDRANHRRRVDAGVRRVQDGGITCIVTPSDTPSMVTCPEGTLTLDGIAIEIESAQRATAVLGGDPVRRSVETPR